MRIGVNSGSLPKHLHELERENAVEALVAAAVEYVELMDRLGFEDFKVSIKSTSVPNTIASNRLLSREDRQPAPPRHHRGRHEVVRLAEVGGRPRHAAGRRDRRHDPHLALHLPRGGGGQGRLGDPQGAQAARARPGADRLPDLRPPPVRHGHGGGGDRAAPASYDEPIEVAVLGCAVNGIGEASHADFGITGAKNEGLIFAHGKPLRKVPQDAPRRRALRRDRQVARPRDDRGRRAQGRRGRRVAREDRGGERRRADPRADRSARGRRGERGERRGAAHGRRAQGQADRAGRGGVAHRGTPLHARLAARAALGHHLVRSWVLARRARGRTRRRPTGRTACPSSGGARRSPRPPGSAHGTGRSVVMASNASHTATTREPSGISSPRSPSG